MTSADQPRARSSHTVSPRQTARDALEVFARQIYFRSPALMRWRTARHEGTPIEPQVARLSELREALDRAGATPGALVMAHTSVSGVSLVDDARNPGAIGPVGVAKRMVSVLRSAVGDAGTVVLPTHPLYRADPGYHVRSDKSDLVLTYDPDRTPSSVGLASELFRRLPGAQRSLHPLQSISCLGPRSTELLADNLTADKPLPHGIHSGYYRLCRANGVVLSIGVPLIEYCTLVHVAEDVRDASWPTPNFFRERRFLVRQQTTEGEWIVRERRPLYARSYCEGRLHRDLLREGILKEARAGSLRVDYARSGEIFEFMMRRNERSTYPYLLPALARIGG